MRLSLPQAAVLLLALPTPGAAATASARVEVVRTSDPPCVDLRLIVPHRPPEVLTDVCHGWSRFDCGGKTLVDVHPVVQAQAAVLLPAEGETLNVGEAIDREIRRRWPAYELLHLDFGRPTCAGAVLTVPFGGSRAPSAGGEGKGLKGAFTVISARSVTLQLEPDDPL